MSVLSQFPWSCYTCFHGYTTPFPCSPISMVTGHPFLGRAASHSHDYITVISMVLLYRFPWLQNIRFLWVCYTHFHGSATPFSMTAEHLLSLVVLHPFPRFWYTILHGYRTPVNLGQATPKYFNASVALSGPPNL